MTSRPLITTLCLTAVVMLALSGCGRKGALEPAADQNPAYPRKYPAPEVLDKSEQDQMPGYGVPGQAAQPAGGPYRAYSNYPRPKQSSTPYSTK